MGRSGEDESQEDVLMDEAPSNISQASTLQANREGKTSWQNAMFILLTNFVKGFVDDSKFVTAVIASSIRLNEHPRTRR